MTTKKNTARAKNTMTEEDFQNLLLNSSGNAFLSSSIKNKSRVCATLLKGLNSKNFDAKAITAGNERKNIGGDVAFVNLLGRALQFHDTDQEYSLYTNYLILIAENKNVSPKASESSLQIICNQMTQLPDSDPKKEVLINEMTRLAVNGTLSGKKLNVTKPLYDFIDQVDDTTDKGVTARILVTAFAEASDDITIYVQEKAIEKIQSVQCDQRILSHKYFKHELEEFTVSHEAKSAL